MPSRNCMCRWTLRFNALPKRWISATARVWTVLGEPALFLNRCLAMQRRTMPGTWSISSGNLRTRTARQTGCSTPRAHRLRGKDFINEQRDNSSPGPQPGRQPRRLALPAIGSDRCALCQNAKVTVIRFNRTRAVVSGCMNTACSRKASSYRRT